MLSVRAWLDQTAMLSQAVAVEPIRNDIHSTREAVNAAAVAVCSRTVLWQWTVAVMGRWSCLGNAIQFPNAVV